MESVCDVIVVGAGVSGLIAARELSQRGLKVMVLEATNRAGGRVCTLYPGPEDHQFGWADLGAGFLTPDDEELLLMCKEYGLKTLDANIAFGVIEGGRGRSIRDWLASLSWKNPPAALDLRVMLRRLDEMCKEVPLEKPWDAPRAVEWDQMTLLEFCDKHCWTQCCRDYLMMMVRVLTSAEAGHLSLLHFLWELCMDGGPYCTLGLTDYSDAVLIEGGSQQLVNKMAADLGQSLLLDQPVTLIQYREAGVKVRTLSGGDFSAKYLVLATPRVTQMKIHFEPSLPAAHTSLIQRSPLGVVMKCVVFYEKPFWAASGRRGILASMDATQPVSAVHIEDAPRAGLFLLECFVTLQHVVRLSRMDDNKKRAAVCESVARLFRSDEALTPVKFLSRDWSAAPYECGGYSGYYSPGVLTSYGGAMRAPIGGRVFLAGTELATRSRGSLSGALMSGQRAAREVLQVEGLVETDQVRDPEPAVQEQEKHTTSTDYLVSTLCTTLALGSTLVIYWLTN